MANFAKPPESVRDDPQSVKSVKSVDPSPPNLLSPFATIRNL
jgi:hypothetical protein